MAARRGLYAVLMALLLLTPAWPGASGAESVPEPAPQVVNVEVPSVSGPPRFQKVLTASPGSWQPSGVAVTYQWLRDGTAIPGATRRRYRVAVADVGAQLAVQVVASAPDHRPGTATSRAVKGLHRVPVRHVVQYQISSRGTLRASMATFRRQVAETFADPRGWRGAGVQFEFTRRRSGLVVVLAQAERVPDFSSQCSAYWSCRVGKYVVINEDRWRFSTPLWREERQTNRDYRHLVLNHEGGHWLGHGHAGCARQGARAPVMMPQSKGLYGCRPNPWPIRAERSTPRF